jgi:hypothetical protein
MNRAAQFPPKTTDRSGNDAVFAAAKRPAPIKICLLIS